MKFLNIESSISFRDSERVRKACAPYRLTLGGMHRRNRLGEKAGLGAGSAIEFQEHRPYQPGDDLRRLDWAAYARSGQMMIRLERREVMPQLDVTVDLSRSMWGLTEIKRQLFIETLAAILFLADRGRLDVRCLLAGDAFHVVQSRNLAEILAACRHAAGDGRRNPADHMETLLASRRRHSAQIWITDLLFPHDPLLLGSRFAGENAISAILQVLDPSDVNPSTARQCRLESCEDGQSLDLNLDESIIENYRRRFESLRNQWRERTLARGNIFLSLTAPLPIEKNLSQNWLPAGLVEPGA
ncbi:MAG: DUF58 domain-containing protein [Verrucomicrobiae bacterium]|nr:DUF58 domain-containing protein [Verrucomicrobiae bacterium]